MSATPPDAASHCASLVRASDFERYAATLFVKEEQRRAMLALFAFNIEIARTRAQISQPLAGEIRLQWWSDLLDGTAHGEAEANPVAAELSRTIERHALPRVLLGGMIDAHRFDIYDEPMRTRAELERYLHGTASALFRLSGLVLGGEARDDELMQHAGLAFGMLRIIEAVPVHASRGQVYLPADELGHSGVGIGDIAAGNSSPALVRYLQQLAADARSHLCMALQGLAGNGAAERRALLPLASVDRRLRRIAFSTWQPFAPAPQPSNLATLWTLWRATRREPFKS